MLEDTKLGYKAKIILLKDEGHAVPEIRKITNHHDIPNSIIKQTIIFDMFIAR